MDASNKLKPALIRNQCNEAITEMEADNQNFETMKGKITDFVENQEIQSQKFDNLRLQLYDYLMVLDSMIAANNAHIADYGTLSTSVGEKDLDGTTLIEQKTNAEQSKISAVQSAFQARNLANYWRSIDPVRAMNLDRNALGYDQEASNWQDIINILQSDMDFYDTLESTTAALFTSGAATLATAAEAIADISTSFKNGTYTYNENAAWRNELASLTSCYIELEDGSPLWEFLASLGVDITQILLGNMDEISIIKDGVYFTLKNIDGKYHVFLSGSQITGGANMTIRQIQDYLRTNFKDIDWSRFEVKTIINRGIKLDSPRGNKFFSAETDSGRYNSSVEALDTIDNFGSGTYRWNTVMDAMNPLDNYKNWGSVGNLGKVAKGLGIAGDLYTVGSNFFEAFYEDGEFSFSGDKFQDFAIDTAVDVGTSAAAAGAGALIGSAFLPPVGTIVGAGAGFLIDTAINYEGFDWDNDGQKDSLVDGAKMLVDDACDFIGDLFW